MFTIKVASVLDLDVLRSCFISLMSVSNFSTLPTLLQHFMHTPLTSDFKSSSDEFKITDELNVTVFRSKV